MWWQNLCTSPCRVCASLACLCPGGNGEAAIVRVLLYQDPRSSATSVAAVTSRRESVPVGCVLPGHLQAPPGSYADTLGPQLVNALCPWLFAWSEGIFHALEACRSGWTLITAVHRGGGIQENSYLRLARRDGVVSSGSPWQLAFAVGARRWKAVGRTWC